MGCAEVPSLWQARTLQLRLGTIPLKRSSKLKQKSYLRSSLIDLRPKRRLTRNKRRKVTSRNLLGFAAAKALTGPWGLWRGKAQETGWTVKNARA